MAKDIIKEKTVLLWLALCVAIMVPVMIADSVLIEVLYDCWPLGRYGNCFAEVPGFLWHGALVIGSALVGGTVAARRMTREKPETTG